MVVLAVPHKPHIGIMQQFALRVGIVVVRVVVGLLRQCVAHARRVIARHAEAHVTALYVLAEIVVEARIVLAGIVAEAEHLLAAPIVPVQSQADIVVAAVRVYLLYRQRSAATILHQHKVVHAIGGEYARLLLHVYPLFLCPHLAVGHLLQHHIAVVGIAALGFALKGLHIQADGVRTRLL